MARQEWTQSDFTAGEWSPAMLGRTNLPRYQSCCSELSNFIALVQGGARSRWGTYYTAETKDSTRRPRLVPFRYSNSQAYVLELGNLYMRVYTQNTRIEVLGTPIEFVTPWAEADLPDLEWAQWGDTAVVVHPTKVPYRIVRISNEQWKVQAAPFIVWPSAELGLKPATTATLSATSGAITITSGAAVFLASDVGRQVIADIGEATITGFVSTTQVNATATGFLATAYTSGNWTITESPKTTLTISGSTGRKNGTVTCTLSANGWRSTDVGSYARINGALIELTGFTSALVMTGKLRELFTSPAVLDAESGAWSLEPRAWSATLGYPRAVALAEQRLIFGGSAAFPLGTWASATGFYYDMTRGERDAAGWAVDFFGNDMSTIMHLVPSPTTLLALTAAAELSAGTGNDEPMTYKTLRPRTGSNNGASRCRPQIVNNDLWFAQDGGTKIRALAFTLTENAFWSPDITWESSHLFASGVREIVFSKDPYPIAYAVLEDGRLAACAVSRQAGVLEHDVLAWSPLSTDGFIESAAVMRYGAEDQLWLAVRRTINGVTKRYIERADWSLQTDCALTGTSGTPTSTWAGFGHLEGKTVQILANGADVADQAVVAGTVQTLEASGVGAPLLATAIEAGLPFEAVMTVPDIEPPGVSFGGAKVRAHEVIVDVLETTGIEVQDAQLKWRPFGEGAFTSPLIPFTGKKSVPNLGWDGGRVTIRRRLPYRAHVRRVIRRYTVNEG